MNISKRFSSDFTPLPNLCNLLDYIMDTKLRSGKSTLSETIIFFSKPLILSVLIVSCSSSCISCGSFARIFPLVPHRSCSWVMPHTQFTKQTSAYLCSNNTSSSLTSQLLWKAIYPSVCCRLLNTYAKMGQTVNTGSDINSV